MAFYLSAQRKHDVVSASRRYREYLEQNKAAFPPSALELATSDWYFDPQDHRCPHDAWLDSITIGELAKGERGQARATSIRIRLLGAYHDLALEFYYPQVVGYELVSAACARGLGDWLYDEFTLSEGGNVLHEIEWRGSAQDEGSRWKICACDVHFSWRPS